MAGHDRSGAYHHGSDSDLVPKATLFGAPPCRLTRPTIALTACLIGFVLAGCGAAVAGFQFQESFAMIMGLMLVVVGIGMMCAGGGVFIYDSYFKKKSIEDPSIQLGEASNFSQLPSSSRSPTHGSADAPPAYDSIVAEPRRRDHQSRSGAARSEPQSSHSNAGFEGSLPRSNHSTRPTPFIGADNTMV